MSESSLEDEKAFDAEWMAFTTLAEEIFVKALPGKEERLTFADQLKALKTDSDRLKCIANNQCLNNAIDHFIDQALNEVNVYKNDSLCTENQDDHCLSSVEPDPDSNIALHQESGQLKNHSHYLRLTSDPMKGRLIVANKDISAGALLGAEDAYIFWLRPKYYQTYCYHCARPLSTSKTIYECKSCYKVRFCGLKCFTQGLEKYHNLECKWIHVLQKWSVGHIALRILLMNGIERLIHTANMAKSSSETRQNELKHDYESVHSLVGEECIRNTSFFLPSLIGSVLLAKFTSRVSLLKNDAPYDTLTLLYLKHVAQFLINTYMLLDEAIEDTRWPNIKVSTKEDFPKIGLSLYVAGSMYSHSCEPNVSKHFIGSKIILMADSDIKEGEEVSISYGNLRHQNHSVYDRQQFLQEYFGFECKCHACEKQLEPVAHAFRCPKCKGNLLENLDKSNYCLSCGSTNLDISRLKSKLEEAEESLLKARKDIESNRISKEVKFQLRKGLKLLRTCYVSELPLNEANLLLAKYYESKENYQKAYEYYMNVMKNKWKIYGHRSPMDLQPLSELHLLALKSNTNGSKVTGELARVLENIRQSEISILTKQQLAILENNINTT